MKSSKSLCFLFLFSMAFILFSCQKDDDIPEPPVPLPDLEGGIVLEIKPGQNSYISENNDRFYTNIFSHKNDSDLYHLKVKPGVKYNLFCFQPGIPYSNLKMVLLTSKRDTISVSTYATGLCEIFFEPNVPDDLYLFVSLQSSVNETLKYNLYFEELAPAKFDFINLKWEKTGNWQVTDTQTLEFIGSGSMKFRWIRLDSIISDNHDISFAIKSATKTVLPSFGIILSGSSEQLYFGDYKEQLPQKGTFLVFTDNQNFRIISLWGNGMGYEYRTMLIPDLDLKTGVNITINHDYYPNKSVYINNIGLHSIYYGSMNKFYLVVEDKDFERIVFKNFAFKAY